MQLRGLGKKHIQTLRRYGAPITLLLFFLFQWAALFPGSKPTWDAAFYYAYTRSIVFDGDLRIANDLRQSYPTASPDFAAKQLDQDTNEHGRVISPFAFGSSFLWLPWLAILRAFAGIGQLLSGQASTLTGFEWYFRLGLATLAMMLGWLAFYTSYRLARIINQRSSAMLATLTVLFTTPLLYYMYAEPLYAHATSAFVTAILVFVWWRLFHEPFTYSGALAFGILIGLAFLVRWQHLIYVVLPLSSLVDYWFSLARGERRRQLKRVLALAIVVGVGTTAAVSLQLAHWKILYQEWITIPQGATFMNWTAPHWYQVLFSTFRGLLPWMPVFFLSFVGLIVGLRKQRKFMLPLLIVLVLAIYVNSSSRDWFAGGAYGPRRFTSELTILIIGYAVLLQALPRRFRLIAGSLMGVILTLHQWILFRFGLDEAIGGNVLT
ncbi:MAG: hypothetical protein ACK2UH_14990, partial [Candidatus Promineifilaceae bacterium]